MVLQAIQYNRGSLRLLDQRKLPQEETWVSVDSVQTAWAAIRDMVVQDAPTVAIAATLALAAQLVTSDAGHQFSSASEAAQHVKEELEYLATSRPNAVNLSEAARKLSRIATNAASALGADASFVVGIVVAACESMLEEEVLANKATGRHGVEALLKAMQARIQTQDKLHLLTHCNTGSLARAEYATALGIIRATAEADKLEHVYCTETRPYNQGPRPTAYEAVHAGLSVTFICDSVAAALMAEGKVDAVVVGADRVAANGDTANKIGTYTLAVLANHHNIPFFVAAPMTTLDVKLAAGSDMILEHATAVTHLQENQMPPDSIHEWTPCFDVTPAALIEGIITDMGLLPKKNGAFDVPAFTHSQAVRVILGKSAPAAPGLSEADPGLSAAAPPLPAAVPQGSVSSPGDPAADTLPASLLSMSTPQLANHLKNLLQGMEDNPPSAEFNTLVRHGAILAASYGSQGYPAGPLRSLGSSSRQIVLNLANYSLGRPFE